MRWLPYKLKDGSAAPDTIVSDQGYAVLRCRANGVPTGRFIAFRGRFGAAGYCVLGGYESADDAKAACAAHAAKQEEIA